MKSPLGELDSTVTVLQHNNAFDCGTVRLFITFPPDITLSPGMFSFSGEGICIVITSSDNMQVAEDFKRYFEVQVTLLSGRFDDANSAMKARIVIIEDGRQNNYNHNYSMNCYAACMYTDKYFNDFLSFPPSCRLNTKGRWVFCFSANKLLMNSCMRM